ncbi:secreted alpha/beta hydrolase superfamiy protein,related [Neospora caninum Liverpool]|uniref:Secreted alpha/beta hydrolase superfamiy protein,related n=1 Tax=Neospora caninum (strain Liverpool) TaxID=572307 RepID=F0VGD6_NEOCL|nr:secreted alpha/beta hydrolase superfamiy protein,related [Neospora caninum Liverpool]CBZ52780.1 secreted alpha/beta hydrolase superfamiy protein,related [Neospora caninum Liverpool]|eukprot:XP_003882812.1 secreted alpha/beta hydrolase superfamiy protein,related [Neospora caninum Liverpool]
MALHFGAKLDRTGRPPDKAQAAGCNGAAFPGEEQPVGRFVSPETPTSVLFCSHQHSGLGGQCPNPGGCEAPSCLQGATACEERNGDTSASPASNCVSNSGGNAHGLDGEGVPCSAAESRRSGKVGGLGGEKAGSLGKESPARQKRVLSEAEINLEKILEEDSGRDCNADYPVPKWLRGQGVCSPFTYFRSFKASLGIINYDLRGPPGGPIVVTFHGLNGTQLTFYDMQEVLARFGYRTLIFDLYGHGLSASPRYSFFLKRYGLQFFIKQTDELLEHLGLQNERISVVGFSMGCVIAAEYALHRKELVDRICLVAPAGLLPNKPFAVRVLQRFGCKKGFVQKYEEEEHEERRRSSASAAAAGPTTAEAPEEPRKKSLSWRKRPSEGDRKERRREAGRASGKAFSCRQGSAAADSTGAPGDAKRPSEQGAVSGVSPGELLWRRLMWQLYVKKGVVATFVGCVTHVPLWDARKIYERVGETGKPVLMLWGQDDAVAPLSCATSLRALMPNSHLITFPACSHLVLADRAQASIGCVMAFLDFPATCGMQQWRFALPFDSEGTYVQPQDRAPPGTRAEDYLHELGYSPKFTIRLAQTPDGAGARQGPLRRRTREETDTDQQLGKRSDAPRSDGKPDCRSDRRSTCEAEGGERAIQRRVRAQMKAELAAHERGSSVARAKTSAGSLEERQQRRIQGPKRSRDCGLAPVGERADDETPGTEEEDAFGETRLLPVERFTDSPVEGENGASEDSEFEEAVLMLPDAGDEETAGGKQERTSETVHLPLDGLRSRSASAAAAAATSHLLSFDSNSTQEILLQGSGDQVLVPTLSRVSP